MLAFMEKLQIKFKTNNSIDAHNQKSYLYLIQISCLYSLEDKLQLKNKILDQSNNSFQTKLIDNYAYLHLYESEKARHKWQ